MIDGTPTVYVVEDDDHLRSVVSTMMRSVGWHVQDYSHPHEFLANYDPQVPGCLVFDLRLPDMSGLELQRVVARQGSWHPFLVMTAYGDVQTAVAAMQQGALDFIEKPFSRQQLLDRVQQAVNQDQQRRQLVVRQQQVRGLIAALTGREREVLDLVVEGKLTKEIARQLGINPKTVEVHRANVVRKMGADSVAELIQVVMQLPPGTRGEGSMTTIRSTRDGLSQSPAPDSVTEV
jgi:FixJ family two-component response regulator